MGSEEQLKISNAKTRCLIYVLKTRWLVACKSNCLVTCLKADDISLFLTHIHFLFKFPGPSHKLPNGNDPDFLN